MRLFTIGHSNHTTEKFVQLVRGHGIAVVVDVRSNPYSRWVPHFNRKSLARELAQRQIGYAFAGHDLGGRPADTISPGKGSLTRQRGSPLPSVDWAALMQRQSFAEAIRQLLTMAGETRTAVLCSEEDPMKCHRHHLIATFVMAEYPEVEVHHIRGDGSACEAASLADSVRARTSGQPRMFE